MDTQTTDKVPATSNGHSSTQSRPVNFIRPVCHISELKDGFELQVELPGVPKDGLEVSIEQGELTVVGHRAEFKTGADLLYRESRPADFRRVFEVDSTIDVGKITAALDQGVLTLTLPKAEAAKSRKIEVHGLN